jgi:hypothetical protein
MDRKELLGLRNFGQKSLVELYEALSTRDLIPEGTPLDVPKELIYGGEAEGVEGEGEGEGVTGEDGIEAEAGENDAERAGEEPEGYMAEPGTDPAEGSTEIVDALGVSEGSAADSAGVFTETITGDNDEA